MNTKQTIGLILMGLPVLTLIVSYMTGSGPLNPPVFIIGMVTFSIGGTMFMSGFSQGDDDENDAKSIEDFEKEKG